MKLLLIVSILAISACANTQDIKRKNIVNSKLVRIYSPDTERRGGTGFFINYNNTTHLITNAHVCEVGRDNIVAIYSEYLKSKGYGIVKRVDKAHDLCLIESIFDVYGLNFAKQINIDDQVYIVGYPELKAVHLSKGYILGIETAHFLEDIDLDKCKGEGLHIQKKTLFLQEIRVCVRKVDSYYTDAEVFPGNSGSPVVDNNLNVKGIVFAASATTNFGLFIPTSTIKKFLSEKKKPAPLRLHLRSTEEL